MDKKKQQGIGCLALLGFVIILAIMLTFASADRPRDSLQRVCAYANYPTTQTCDVDALLRDYNAEVSICQEAYGNAREDTVQAWVDCLESWNVPIRN